MARWATSGRTPASTARTTRVTGLEYILAARDLVEMARRVEKARIALEEIAIDDRNVARFARLEEEYRDAGGYQAESEARTITAGLGLAQDRLALPVGALSGGERRRLELARILFGGSDLLLLDEPTNHLDADAKVWLMKFLAAYTGALMVVSHDLGLLDASITRILHLDRDGVVEYKGTYSQYREARAQDEERLHGARRAPGAGDQAAEDARRLDARPDGQARAEGQDARHRGPPSSSERKVEGPTRERTVTVPLPRAAALRARRCSRSKGLAKSYGGPPVFDDVSFDVGTGRAPADHGTQRRGQDQPAADPHRADRGRRGHVPRSGTAWCPATTRRSTRASPTGVDVLTHMRAESPADDQQLRSLLGMFGLSGAIAFQDAGTLSRRREDQARAGPAGGGPQEPAAARRAHEQPRSAQSRTAIAEALQDWPGAMVIVSHDTEFVEALAPERVLLMPDGDAGLLGRGPARPRRAGLTGGIGPGGASPRSGICFAPAVASGGRGR